MPSQTAAKVLSDLLRWEANFNYTREQGTIKNPGAGAVTLQSPLGVPLKLTGAQWEIAVIADVAAVKGLLLTVDPITLGAGATSVEKHLILARGPAIVSREGIPTTDPAAGAWPATLLTTLLALGIKAEANPPMSGASPLLMEGLTEEEMVERRLGEGESLEGSPADSVIDPFQQKLNEALKDIEENTEGESPIERDAPIEQRKKALRLQIEQERADALQEERELPRDDSEAAERRRNPELKETIRQ